MFLVDYLGPLLDHLNSLLLNCATFWFGLPDAWRKKGGPKEDRIFLKAYVKFENIPKQISSPVPWWVLCDCLDCWVSKFWWVHTKSKINLYQADRRRRTSFAEKFGLGQGGITCEAIDEPGISPKAIDKRVIINFRDKNVIIARFRDKNEVFVLFIIYIYMY